MSRFPYQQLFNSLLTPLVQLEQQLQQCSQAHPQLSFSLLELVRYRVSSLNGCAFCIDMHSKEARHHGESEQRLYGTQVWRDTPYYSALECAALEWAEALTLTEGRVDDETYQRVAAHFPGESLVHLSLAITAINSWNRLERAFKSPVGGYQVGSLG